MASFVLSFIARSEASVDFSSQGPHGTLWELNIEDGYNVKYSCTLYIYTIKHKKIKKKL